MHHCHPLFAAFGLAVRSRREELAISQEALAELAHLHRTYIGSVERGERNISLKNIQLLATALGTRPSDLLAEAEYRLQKAQIGP